MSKESYNSIKYQELLLRVDSIKKGIIDYKISVIDKIKEKSKIKEERAEAEIAEKEKEAIGKIEEAKKNVKEEVEKARKEIEEAKKEILNIELLKETSLSKLISEGAKLLDKDQISTKIAHELNEIKNICNYNEFVEINNLIGHIFIGSTEQEIKLSIENFSLREIGIKLDVIKSFIEKKEIEAKEIEVEKVKVNKIGIQESEVKGLKKNINYNSDKLTKKIINRIWFFGIIILSILFMSLCFYCMKDKIGINTPKEMETKQIGDKECQKIDIKVSTLISLDTIIKKDTIQHINYQSNISTNKESTDVNKWIMSILLSLIVLVIFIMSIYQLCKELNKLSFYRHKFALLDLKITYLDQLLRNEDYNKERDKEERIKIYNEIKEYINDIDMESKELGYFCIGFISRN